MKTSITTANHSNLNSSSWTGETATNKPKRTVNISEEPTTRFESEETTWSQEQQKCLENALKEIPKDAANRWDLIAEQVPNKTKVTLYSNPLFSFLYTLISTRFKDDCILRYKQLCASIKNKKWPVIFAIIYSSQYRKYIFIYIFVIVYVLLFLFCYDLN